MVDQALWQWLKSYLADPNLLKAGILGFSKLNENILAPIREAIEIKTHLLEESRQELQRIADLYIDGNFTKQGLMDRTRKLQTRITKINSELSKLRKKLDHCQTLALNLEDAMKTCVGISAKLSNAQISFLQQRKLIEAMDDSGAKRMRQNSSEFYPPQLARNLI